MISDLNNLILGGGVCIKPNRSCSECSLNKIIYEKMYYKLNLDVYQNVSYETLCSMRLTAARIHLKIEKLKDVLK